MNIIDRRRVSRDRSTENRTRFIKRYKEAIKRQLPDILNNRSLRDNDDKTFGGGRVKVNKKSTREPFFHYGDGGQVDTVLPGNDQYIEGDTIDKPMNGGGRGRQAGDGESEDDFVVDLSREEFLDLIFDGCELPNLSKTELIKLKERKFYHAGFQSEGPPNRLSIIRTYKQSFVRRIPILTDIDERIEQAEKRLALLEDAVGINEQQQAQIADEIKLVTELIAKLKQEREDVPLFDDIDLRYRATVVRDNPKLHATMVMLMDNSGSMGEKEKTIARKFFLILYLFLKRNYDEIDLVFVSHTMDAREMDEEEFFNTRESGGTKVSSGLDLIHKIIDERLKGKTNIYIAQVSDGDNEETDNGTCTEILEDDILPHTRYYAYMQVDDYHGEDDDKSSHLLSFGKGLWKAYEHVAAKFPNFQTRRVTEEKEIFPVFRELFKKRR